MQAGGGRSSERTRDRSSRRRPVTRGPSNADRRCRRTTRPRNVASVQRRKLVNIAVRPATLAAIDCRPSDAAALEPQRRPPETYYPASCQPLWVPDALSLAERLDGHTVPLYPTVSVNGDSSRL